MQRTYAKLSIRTARYLQIGSSAEMRAEVSGHVQTPCNSPTSVTESAPTGMVHKSLERLFPVDQSMVVVIDDRADVWDWSPNLVKVVPCQFKHVLIK